MPGSAPLTSSRWAPAYLRNRTPQHTVNNANTAPSTQAASTPTRPATGLTPADKLTGINRLFARLEWKAELIIFSREPTHAVSEETGETMFRLDFYELYALLERLLVLLLEACGIFVRSGREEMGRNGAGLARAAHRFHANVLEALEKEDCPLKGSLGEGGVKSWLNLAKVFRNRWKDVEDEGVQGEKVELDKEALGRMMNSILRGLRDAQEVVGKRLEGKIDAGTVKKEPVKGATNGDAGVESVHDGRGASGATEVSDEDSEMDDAPWEAVEDAMDWDWDVT